MRVCGIRLSSKFLLLFLALISTSVAAQDHRSIVERFERKYRSAHTLQATFFQRYLENGKEVRSEAGVAYFGRPGKMRWEYQSPERNLYLVDGKWSWFYVPADHSVTRIRAKESSDWRTPFALLAGEMKVSRICDRVTMETGGKPVISGNAVLRCDLHGSPSAKERAFPHSPAEDKVLFEVNPVTGELKRILVSDAGGVQIEFLFASWQFDPPLDKRLFSFEPPKGIAILDGNLAIGDDGR